MGKQTRESINAYKERKSILRKIRYEKRKSEGNPESLSHLSKPPEELKAFLENRRVKNRANYAANLESRRKRMRLWTKARNEKKKANGILLDDSLSKLTDTPTRIKARKRSADYYKTPLGRLAQICRARLSKAIKSRQFKKVTRTSEMLGCSWEFLESYLEGKFEKGMSWSNYGQWHIDHIIPLSSSGSELELLKNAHFSNLQPLWAFENHSKGGKVIQCQPELLLNHY